MAHFDRFDICEAYAVLEWDWHSGGMLHERPSNQRRNESTDVQLHRMRFRPRPNLSFDTLTENGREIYVLAVQRLGLATTVCSVPKCGCFYSTPAGKECRDCGGTHVLLRDYDPSSGDDEGKEQVHS